jgi:hypothetical protein
MLSKGQKALRKDLVLMLQGRKKITLTSSEVGRMKKKTKKRRKEKSNHRDKS